MSRKRSLITSLHESTTSKYFKPDGAVQPVSSALIAFVYVTADMQHCLLQAAKHAAESGAQMINFIFSPNVIANRHHADLLNCLQSCWLPVTGREQFLSNAHGCYVSCWLSSFASGAQHECLENSRIFSVGFVPHGFLHWKGLSFYIGKIDSLMLSFFVPLEAHIQKI